MKELIKRNMKNYLVKEFTINEGNSVVFERIETRQMRLEKNLRIEIESLQIVKK